MASEILITCSLAWLIIWSFLGMLAGKRHPQWLQEVKTISQEGDLGKFWATYDDYIIQKTGHAHANSFASVAFLIGLAMKLEIIGFSSQFQTILAIWMFVGVILAGFGDRLRNVPLAGAGGVLFLTALITSFVGLFV
jgi:hypothetical protein